MDIRLDKKNAVVCGSTQGIGKAVASELAKSGANITLIARNEDSLKNTLSSLDVSAGQKHSYIAVDFSYPDILTQKINEYVNNNPPVHILVNNTGGPASGNITDAEPGAFQEAFSAHVLCNQILVKALQDGMKRQKYGRIINIISTSVRQPIKGLGVSNTTRAAVAAWAKTMSFELAPFGITVNNLLPGATKTQRLFSLFKARSKALGKDVKEIENEWLKEIPAGRFGEPEELAYAAVFLASPFASYINGVSIQVDGGRITAI